MYNQVGRKRIMHRINALLLLLWRDVICEKADKHCTQIINISNGENAFSVDDNVSKEYIHQEMKQLMTNLTNLLLIHDSTDELLARRLKPRDCQDIQAMGSATTGTYTIYPGSGMNAITVRCDMDNAGGGWTVFQRRVSSSDFSKTWNEYQAGFGNISGNFWLGLQSIHMISTQAWYQLRIDMTNLDDEYRYAEYQLFSLGDAETKYKLQIDGFSGPAGDSLNSHNGMKFTTKDRDNDNHPGNCAKLYGGGGWWYNKGYDSSLNDDYGNTQVNQGILWYHWMGATSPLKTTEMKIRRWEGILGDY